ncbi:MAG: site-specific integrase [Anaerolineales bacterium]|nr:site-specific integrase [Rhodocyclaceae bacterium]MCW5886704.1 site-specific integrase [Anaerolineales bacterium]
MKELRRKVLLPVFQLSELADQGDPRSIERTIKMGKGHAPLTYRYRYVWDEGEGRGYNYNLLPVVLDRKSVPWALGTLFILSQLESETQPVIATYHSLADDLGAFKEWLDSQDNPEELLFNFPKPKLRRTTYRYRGFLQQQIRAREIGARTAKRRMGTVVSFYKWIIASNHFTPKNPTWEERDYLLSFKTAYGRQISKNVASTDLSIPAPKSADDFDGTILDGGRLRPLTGNEQEWLLEAAEAKGNSECLLLQLFMLGTGARIESACTLRVRHFFYPAPPYSKNLTGEGEVYRLKAGPGTGIETKGDKPGTFQVPRALYELLHIYALSRRAEVRRNRYVSKHGEHPDPYLFLTQQGSPYYIAKAEALRFNPDLRRRYQKNGQPIRQFIKDHALPYVQNKYDKAFYYRPHDLRASFGINTTEELLKLVEEGKITLHKARLIVKDLMWHKSVATTDLYLDYKNNNDVFYKAINGFGEHLQQWADRAMKGITTDEKTLRTDLHHS